MDFQTRFQGKMQKISKDGGINEMVANSDKQINPLNKITIRDLHRGPDGNGAIITQTQRISYGGQSERTD